ncbi:Hypothetical predicted protein [Cloeon dipterum]|uniref:C2H2-type domain-containing protein n=2 Tax=Cloeon dipterum TaxID=197152 RepID=A0A8S1CRY6_9INSE|nr:Hypothetical predicted protein [Cloeon dipterum]
MRQTRRSIVLQAAEAEGAAKQTRSTAKSRQSLATASTKSDEAFPKKLSLAASKPLSNKMSGDEDVRSVHSEESDDQDEVNFSIKCLKCDAEFSRKSYLFSHFKLAHNIDLSTLTPEKKENHSSNVELNFQKEKLSYPKNGNRKIEDEDYFSCSSSFSSEICFVEKSDEVSSDLDVENNLDDTTVCPDCNTRIVTHLDADAHANKKCLLRKLSVEHQDIILNQPFVNLQRLSKIATRKRRHNVINFPHVCPLCGVRFASNIDMKIHAQMEHRVDPNLMKFVEGNGEDNHKFLIASRKKKRDCVKNPNPKKSDLAQNGSGKVGCPTCSKSFGSKVKLEQHMEKSHPNVAIVLKQKYDHNADPLAKALAKRMRLTKQDPRARVKSLFNFMGLRLQHDQSKWI